jgi:hypothetical protein
MKEDRLALVVRVGVRHVYTGNLLNHLRYELFSSPIFCQDAYKFSMDSALNAISEQDFTELGKVLSYEWGGDETSRKLAVVLFDMLQKFES